MRIGRRREAEDAAQFYYEHWSAFPGTPGATGLYEGITVAPGQRAGQHKGSKGDAYWSIVGVILVRRFPSGTTRAEALEYESMRIRTNRWPWNDAGNPDFDRQALKRAKLLGRRPRPIEVWRWYLWRARVWSVRAAGLGVWSVFMLAVGQAI